MNQDPCKRLYGWYQEDAGTPCKTEQDQETRPQKSRPQKKRRERECRPSAYLQMLYIFVIAVVTAAIAVCLLIMDRPDFSAIEQRSLAKMPEFTWKSFFSGEYADGIRAYYDDTVPNRDMLKEISSTILEYTGVRLDDVKIIGPVIKDPTGSNPTAAPAHTDAAASPDRQDPSRGPAGDGSANTGRPDAPTPTPVPENPDQEIEYNNNGIIISDGRAMELFGGNLNVARRYAEIAEAYQRDMGPNVNVYSMVIPVSVAFYCPRNYQSLTEDQTKVLQAVRESLYAVREVPIYDVMASHKSEYIYFRTDHHWTLLGAYYATQTFAEIAGVPFSPLSAYETVEKPNFLGSMYGLTNGDPSLRRKPDTFTYYKPGGTYSVRYYNGSGAPLYYDYGLYHEGYSLSDWYSMVLGGDEYLVQIQTGVKNGRKLCIIKDSFGRAPAVFLTDSFEEIYVIDPRYFNLNAVSFMKEHGVTDLLFSLCVFQASSATPAGNTFVDQLEDMRTR